ncbi:uncharacterized protein LOC135324087 [Dromaius novaehollandiae]|uniref:uncharacterized protein LOC135324087 n=1 Tax=Dromaius novaehollandiae TaxID=8790 RepID=UPI00311DF24F
MPFPAQLTRDFGDGELHHTAGMGLSERQELMASQWGSEHQLNYKYVSWVSNSSSVNYSCKYESRDEENQVKWSQLSRAEQLDIKALGICSEELCTAPGTLLAPTLLLDTPDAQEGDAVLLQCTIFSDNGITRVIFCKDGAAVSADRGSEKGIYTFREVASVNTSGDYSCRYETRDAKGWVNQSQLSPAQRLHVRGPQGTDIPPRPAIPLWVWMLRSALVLLLLASAPVTTFLLEKSTRWPPTPTVDGDVPRKANPAP